MVSRFLENLTKKRCLILKGGMLYLFLVFSGCVNRKAQEQAIRTESIVNNKTIPVVVQNVKSSDYVHTKKVTGEFKAEEDTVIVGKVPGKVSQIFAKEGDIVKKGDVLLQLDDSDYRSKVHISEAQLSSAESSLSQAKLNLMNTPLRSSVQLENAKHALKQAKLQYEKLKNGPRDEERNKIKASLEAAKNGYESSEKALQRSRKLYQIGGISLQQIEKQEAEYLNVKQRYISLKETWNILDKGPVQEDLEIAEKQILIAEESVKNAEAVKSMDKSLYNQVKAAEANVKMAKENLVLSKSAWQDTKIVAPFDGYVSMGLPSVGSMVTLGSPVARVTNMDKLYISSEVSLDTGIELKNGMDVDIELSHLEKKRMKGRITSINPISDVHLRLLKLRIDLDTPNIDMKDKNAQEDLKDKEILYPGMTCTGLVHTDSVKNVFIIPKSALVIKEGESYLMMEENGIVKQRKAEIGLSQEDFIQVKNIFSGEKVIVKGNNFVKDGSRVTIEKTL